MLALIHRLSGFKLYIYAFGLVSLLSVSFSLVTPSQASAWMQEYCDFKLSVDAEKIDVTCNDNRDNGTLDGHSYKRDGSSSTYKLTQYGAIDCDDEGITGDDCKVKYVGSDDTYSAECESTLTLTDRFRTKATVSGDYARLFDLATWQVKCQELNPGTDSGRITIDSLDTQVSTQKSRAWKELEKRVERHVSLVGCSNSYQVASAGLVGSPIQEDDGTHQPMSQACFDLAKCFDEAFTHNRLLDVEGNADAIRADLRSCIRSLTPPSILDPNPPPSLTSLTNNQINTAVNAAIGVTGNIIPPDEEDLEDEDPPGGEETTTCSIDGVGWIICPMMKFMGQLNDAAHSLIAGFLIVEPRLLTDPETESAWKSFRDLANVLFVVFFLVILYSQMTGAGISNYGIKKMLPKLIAAAILVNISYYICQIAVDLSNIIGSSMYGFFKDLPTATDTTADFSDGLSWEKVIGYALAATAALLVAVLLAFTIGTAALLAFAMAVIILIARKAILILLVVISPLAFVAYLLPNTESWFKKWWKMFSTLLMIFPVIGVVFGASTLAARIVNNSAGDPDDSSVLLQLTALGILAVPLFAVPILLKGATAAMGTIGQKLQGFQDKANTGAANAAKTGRLGEAKAAYDARKQHNKVAARLGHGGKMTRAGDFLQRRGGRVGGAVGGALKRSDVSKLGSSFDESKLGRTLGGDRGQAAAKYEYNKHLEEEVGRQETLLSDKTATELRERLTNESGKYSQEMKIAAAKRIMETGKHEEKLEALDYLADAGHRGVKGIDDVQQFSADAIAKQGYTGVGDTGYKELKEGTFGKDGKSVSQRASERVVAGKISAQGLSKLAGADIRHTAFDAAAKTKLKATLADADLDPQTKRLINDDVRNAINAL